MAEILRREFIYVWYYFSVQFEQIFRYWVLGMALGSVISVFGKQKIHQAFQALGHRQLGVLGIAAASALGIASPLCMYGTIPIAASFSEKGIHLTENSVICWGRCESDFAAAVLSYTSGMIENSK